MLRFSSNSNKCYVSGCKADGAVPITVRDLSKPEVQKYKSICRNCYRQKLCNGFSPMTVPGTRPTPCSNKNVTDCFTSPVSRSPKQTSQQFYCASCADRYLRQTQLKLDLNSPGGLFTTRTPATGPNLPVTAAAGPAAAARRLSTCSDSSDFEDVDAPEMQRLIAEMRVQHAEQKARGAEQSAAAGPAASTRPLSTCSHSSDFVDMDSPDMQIIGAEMRVHNAEQKAVAAEQKAAAAEVRAENAESQSGRCVVCLEGNLEILILPCNHACLCQGCSAQLLDNSLCPICRGRIVNRQRIFMP
jgi:hypothetical protein